MKKLLLTILLTVLATISVQKAVFDVDLELLHAYETVEIPIVITEIAATEPSDLEWIEIQNIGEENVNLEGWKFIENDVNHGISVFQGGADLKAGEIAIIANKADLLKEAYPLLENTIFDSSWGSLKQSGEEIGLRNELGELQELFTYTENLEHSLQKIHLNTNDYSSNNWTNSPHTIGSENLFSDLELEELEEILEQSATEEIAATVEIKPATEDINSEETEDKIEEEITEGTTLEKLKPTALITIQSGVTKAMKKVTINLDGTSSTDPKGQKLTYYWDFGDNYIYENKNPPSHSFKEVGTYLITLRVTNEDGLFDETTLQVTVLPEEDFVAQTSKTSKKSSNKTTSKNSTKKEKTSSLTDKSQGKSEKANSQDSTNQKNNPTDQNANQSPANSTPKSYPALLLSEIFPNPAGRDQGQEWIELYNPNEHPVNIKDYVLDDYTEKGSAKMKLKEIELAAHSHYLMFDPSININNSNEEIQLLDPNGTLLDKIYFSESKENQSYARMKNEWLWTTFPTPNFTNEIISENLEIAEKAKAKPEYKNGDLSSEIYISEILPNPLGEDAKGEWVELYNASQRDINLGNWKLDDKEGGSKPYTVPDDIIIKAKSHLTLPRTDTKLSLDNREDSVRLFNFEEEIQDELTYEKAKENLSFAKTEVIYEDRIEIDWIWTPVITKNTHNQKLYRIRGEVEEKENENILIKARTLKLAENNELHDIVLQPGNLVELTYDEKNEVKEI